MVNRLKSLKEKRKRLEFFKDSSLMLAMFFLPLGYDALFKIMMEVTGSYWGADAVFYSISGCFWLSYILLTKQLNKNPNP
jgi:succinate-acetate transporter protein